MYLDSENWLKGTHDELVGQDGIYRRFVVERRQAAGWKVGA